MPELLAAYEVQSGTLLSMEVQSNIEIRRFKSHTCKILRLLI
jgi:hypothetical protein